MTLTDNLERLSAIGPSPNPVVSLYLNTQPNGHGRDQHAPFAKKELKARAATYPAHSAEREMLDRDLERISTFLETGVEPSSNGVAIFACDAMNLFETVQLDVPIDDHELYIGDQPHLYPLARLVSQYPRYAAVLADTNRTRILVVADGGVKNERAIEGVKTRGTSQGGMSQARYQRHIENYHLHHIKEVVSALEKIVAAESITQIVVAGDQVVLALVREQLPKALADMVVDELSLEATARRDEVLRVTLDSMRAADAQGDREHVDAAVGAYRAGGLGVVGPDATLPALTNGQVDELLLTASPVTLERASKRMGITRLAEELVRKAQKTSARLRFIEDPALLEPYGGVAAILRYRV